MGGNFTSKKFVNERKFIFSVYFSLFKKISFLSLLIIAVACTPEEDTVPTLHAEVVKKELEGATRVFKGIYASKESNHRGTLTMRMNNVVENDLGTATGGKAILTLKDGQIIEAELDVNKSTDKASDFNVAFDSEDVQFNFFLDELGNPVVTDVVLKKESGAIVVAEDTAENPVTPVTGVYKCTNCEDKTSTQDGIELNNTERVFNMLLTSKDGQSAVTIQAVLGSLVNAQLLIEESCETSGEYTFCNLSGGPNETTEPVQWEGNHRFTTDSAAESSCSTIWGNLTFNSPENGIIEAEFQSDNTCANNTYYVSTAGNDANTGLTPSDAFRSVKKINSMTIKPGDEVLFAGGQTFEGPLKFRSEDGNDALSPVKVSSYGNGRATIKVEKGVAIDVYNTAGFIISDLIVAGNNTVADESVGIQFYTDLPNNTKLDFVEVRNCEVYGFRDFGIVIGAWNENSKNAGFKNVLFENNEVHDIYNSGISSYGYYSNTKTGYAHSNVVVRNCKVYNIHGYRKADGGHSGNGIMLSDVQNSVIEYSTAYNSGYNNASSQGGPVGIWYWDADQVVIQHNEVYGMKSGTSKDGGGFDLDGGVTNGIMQYNYSHDNHGAGYLVGQFGGARPMANITVRYNISENDAATNGGSVYLFNGASESNMKDIFVYNNTFYTSKAPAIKMLNWRPITQNVQFYNNILYSTNGSSLVEVPSGYHANFAGNLYYTTGDFRINYKGTTYNLLESFRNTGNEVVNGLPVGLQADPLLNDPGNGVVIGYGNDLTALAAYKLRSGSPAIDAGIDLTFETGDQDFFGNNLLQNERPEVGAHAGLSSGAIVSN